MTRHKSRTGVALMTAGVLLILVAIGYVAVNVWEEWSAANASASALDQMESSRSAAETTVENQPLYVQHPDMEMPEVMIDGQAYIGSVSIPKLELELPVISQWTYPRLKLAPCRYSGSVYTDDMIILGHNYERHFRRFTEVETGDEVTFTDMDGNVFRYVVTLKEQIRGNDTERMMAGDWDLTLFTCARGGKMRITLRCDRVDE